MINPSQHNCTGCTACIMSCPIKCIHMKQDEEGFLVPKVDAEKCVKCNLCDQICPELNRKNVINIGKVYAFKNNDLHIRLNSSSGGAFFTVAKYVIEKNGIVCGALFDNNLKLIHKCVSCLEDVKKMMGSKYIQSYIGNVYEEIRKNLVAKKIVLFTGTPCQVAGLKSYLRKEYDNLLTIQLICHGVPSPLLFEKYKIYLKNKYSIKEIEYLSFRKNNKFVITVQGDGRKLSWKGSIDLYLRPFIKGKNYRYCCYSCQYSKNHIADITIGDFWGVEKYYKQFCDSHGISFLMLNTSKGKQIFNLMENVSFIQSKYDIAAKNNNNLLNPTVLNKDRYIFYKDINDSNYIKNLKKFVPLKAIVASKLPNSLLGFLRMEKNE